MPLRLPFEGGQANQDIETNIHGYDVTIRLRWNARDNSGKGAWYFSVYDDRDNLIAGGLKIVLGAYLGRGIDHPLFRGGTIVAVDTAKAKNNGVVREASYHDLGTRVRVYYYTEFELVCLLNQLFYEPNL